MPKPLTVDDATAAVGVVGDLATSGWQGKRDAAILTFQGTNDPLVPFTQAIKLAEGMTTVGIPGRVELLVGAQHGWGGAELERTRAETFRFFDRYLKAGAGASPR